MMDSLAPETYNTVIRRTSYLPLRPQIAIFCPATIDSETFLSTGSEFDLPCSQNELLDEAIRQIYCDKTLHIRD